MLFSVGVQPEWFLRAWNNHPEVTPRDAPILRFAGRDRGMSFHVWNYWVVPYLWFDVSKV